MFGNCANTLLARLRARIALRTPVLGFILALACALQAHAKNLYLRTGATGANSGSDWNNAWNHFSSVQWGTGAGQLSPGDTLWIAGGTYTETLTPGGNGGPAAWITIRRVQSTDTIPVG